MARYSSRALPWTIRPVAGDGLERRGEAAGIAIDHRLSQVGLRREVIVDAGLADAQGLGDIGIAEGTVAARLDQRLGEIEDLVGRIDYVLASDVFFNHARDPWCQVSLLS